MLRTSSVKQKIREALGNFGVDLRYHPRPPGIKDRHLYRPTFSPWMVPGRFLDIYAKARPHTLVPAEKCFTLYTLASQASSLEGSFVECGVYRGGTAMIIADLGKPLHLYDTFEGMREVSSADTHHAGDFADTSVEAVRELVPSAIFHPGWIPESFSDAPEKISFLHVDLDLYRPILDCCEYLYHRMVQGGFMVFDDYGFPSCPGARQAVDEFFADKPEKPLVVSSGHAIVFVHH